MIKPANLRESAEGTVPLERADENGQEGQEERRSGVDLVKVTDGGSNAVLQLHKKKKLLA